jgi:pimeloyl-ACP methyl ester carboxylesterase
MRPMKPATHKISVVAAALLWPVFCFAPALADTGIELEDCRITDTSGIRSISARCGTLRVPENYADPGGKHIDLFVAVIPALSQKPSSTPFTAIAGGPGAASTEFYTAYAGAFSRIQRSHDIVLIDQRGTGRSGALDCPLPEELDPGEWSLDLVRRSARECLASLDADVRQYTTSVAVRDLDRMRAALGYAQLNIYGSSYGTRVAQHYMRRYPERTRTVILDGVVPAAEVLGPSIALDAQRALDQILARCANDADCAGRFPDLAEQLWSLRDRLQSDAIDLSMQDPVSGEMDDTRFTELDLIVALRLMSYHPDSVALMPLLIDAAARGNVAPLAAQSRMAQQDLSDALSVGMHNAVVCTEDAPFYDELELDRAALADTYIGTQQVDTLAAICEIWSAGVIDVDLKEPVTGDIPVLVLSGSADPVTPPSNGQRVADALQNAVHVIGEGQGHGLAAVGCMPQLMAEFVDNGSLDGLDMSCMEKQGPTPFFVNFSGPSP